MPMTKWSGSSKGLITFENDVFQLNFDLVEEDQEILSNGRRKFVNIDCISISSAEISGKNKCN